MPEVFREPEQKHPFSQEDLVIAKKGFEKMAIRLDELWMKDRLTPEEQKEADLLLNNAIVMEELFEEKMPEEFQA